MPQKRGRLAPVSARRRAADVQEQFFRCPRPPRGSGCGDPGEGAHRAGTTGGLTLDQPVVSRAGRAPNKGIDRPKGRVVLRSTCGPLAAGCSISPPDLQHISTTRKGYSELRRDGRGDKGRTRIGMRTHSVSADRVRAMERKGTGSADRTDESGAESSWPDDPREKRAQNRLIVLAMAVPIAQMRWYLFADRDVRSENCTRAVP